MGVNGITQSKCALRKGAMALLRSRFHLCSVTTLYSGLNGGQGERGGLGDGLRKLLEVRRALNLVRRGTRHGHVHLSQ